jgi:serine/threonine protein kinase
LLDFGIASRMGEDGHAESERGAVVGTVEYMSPEQAGSLDLGPRSDLWSVAAVLFRALAGRPPFLGTEFTKTLMTITTQPAPSLREFRPELPEDLIAVIDRALARNPEDRWASAEDMAQALAHCDHARLYACENFRETADLQVVADEMIPSSRLAPVPAPEMPDMHVDATTAKYAVVPFSDTPAEDPPHAARPLHAPTLVIRRRRGEPPILRAV